MKAEQIIIPAGIAVAVGALLYYLRDSGNPMQVVYPNTQASGVPAYAAPQVVFHMGNTIPAPSPNLIYGPQLPLPPTPNYQRSNYSPLNIFNLSPYAAGGALTGLKKDCDCGGCCGCPDGACAKYGDGNQNTCLAANTAEQIRNSSSAQATNLADNIAGSFLSPDVFLTYQMQNHPEMF